MRRHTVIWTTLIAAMLLGGQTYADTLLSFGTLFGSHRGSFGFSISVFEPSPARYRQVYVAPPPPPAPYFVAPTYIAPAPVYSQPTYVAPPPAPYLVAPTYIPPQPVVIQSPYVDPRQVYVGSPVVVTPGYGRILYDPPYSTGRGYDRDRNNDRQGHPDRSGPTRGWDGRTPYQQGWGNH